MVSATAAKDTTMQHQHPDDREPTADERAGMSWWNAMTEAERLDAMRRANADTAAAAWEFHKRQAERPGDKPVHTAL